MTGALAQFIHRLFAHAGWATLRRRLAGQLSIVLLLGPLLIAASPGAYAQSASDDLITTAVNTTVSFDALNNDGPGARFGEVGSPSHGQTWSVGNGHISYLPAANYAGSDAFSYSAFDATGTPYTGLVSVTVDGTPTAVATRDDQISAQEDTPNWIAPLANDAPGPNGVYLTMTVDKSPRHGQLTDQGDGSVIYSPDPDWNGIDSFTYSAADGVSSATGKVQITVDPIADLPKLQMDLVNINQGEIAEIDLLANDIDPDGGSLAFDSITQPQLGTATWDPGDRMLTYVPIADAVGIDTFTYSISNALGQATGTVAVTINGRPTAVDDHFSIPRGQPSKINVLANDSDPEADSLTVIKVGRASHGQVTFDPDSGAITYTDLSGQDVTDSFNYVITDQAGNEARGTVTIDLVDAANGAPVANDDEYLIPSNSAGNTLDLLTNDTDPDNESLILQIDSTPAHGEVTVDAMQQVVYTPASDFSGTDTFAYSVRDPAGNSASATVTLEVGAIDSPPVPGADYLTIDEDMSGAIDLLANDTDVDNDPLAVLSTAGAQLGSVAVDASGVATYMPNPNAFGTDSFTYVVADGRGGTATGTVSITINGVNDAPVASPDSLTCDLDTPLSFDPRGNDVDSDGDYMAVALVTAPSRGSATVQEDGSIMFTPDPAFHGDAVLTYSVTDWTGASSQAEVTIRVGEQNTQPKAVTDKVGTRPDETRAFDVLANDTDKDKDVLTITEVVEQPGHGTVVVTDNKLVYTPEPGYVGSDQLTYTIEDVGGLSATGTVKIRVDPGVPPTPEATP